jgi:ATP-dependent Clp protease ATP-binding subunit ClpA
LQATLHRAVATAAAHRHEYTTLEHLLFALTDDADAAAVMKACQVDPEALKATLASYIDHELKGLAGRRGDPDQQEPTASVHRVIQRAWIHVPGRLARYRHRRQRADGDLLRGGESGRLLLATAGNEAERRGELHRFRNP